MICGLIIFTTDSDRWECQLKLEVHTTAQSVISGTIPHQTNFMLPGHQVIVISLWSWRRERSGESLLFPQADIAFMLFSSGTLLCVAVRILIDNPWWAGFHCRTALPVAANDCKALPRFGSVWFLICLKDGEGVREEDNLLAVMIWSLHYEGSLYESSCFCTVVGAVLSNSQACCGSLSHGKRTSIPAPPLVTGLDADPSVNTWIHASLHMSHSISRHERLLRCAILCVSIKEGRDCGTHVDVISFLCPLTRALTFLAGRRGVCSGQSVVRLTGQLLALVNKTASVKSVLGETLQPCFHRMVWHTPKLLNLHQDLDVPPLTKKLDTCEPLHFCDQCRWHCTKCLLLDLVKGLLVCLCCR